VSRGSRKSLPSRQAIYDSLYSGDFDIKILQGEDLKVTLCLRTDNNGYHFERGAAGR
jgi:hypothetical protein